MRPVRFISFLMFVVFATALPALGQGRIQGRITETGTGEPLIGVNVIVVGSSFGSASDVAGNYLIENLRAGSYNIRVSYIGFETRLYTGINVRNGESTRLDISLEEAVLSTTDEIVVIGERPLVDVEESTSTARISREVLQAAPIRDVQQAVGAQVGIVQDPTGLYIRGGRAEETGFIVDGVSAKDPLAGTGFGLDLGANAFAEVEITTGGVGAEYGDVTSGVVSVQTQDGSDRFSGSFVHKRDDLGFNSDSKSNFGEDLYEFNVSGPVVRGKLRFVLSGQAQLADGFTRHISTPDQVRSSLVGSTTWMPRTGNRWNGLSKLTWEVGAGKRLQASYQRSLTVNQNTRMLQVTGNDAVVQPGFQYAFILQPDHANTYAHDNIVSYLRWSHALGNRSYYDVQVSRLFTRLRADANGRPWRPETVDSELDPFSIITYPPNVFVGPDGVPLDPNALFVLPGPGLVNNGGIATRFHDHFAEEWTARVSYTLLSASQNHRTNAGFELKFNDYQWIDIERPWVGAPIGSDTGSTTNRLGESSDIWRVKPRRGGFWLTHQVRYRGLIANLGSRFEYWSPGAYVDDLVADDRAPIPDAVRESYRDGTVSLFGLRTKLRMLPKLRVSFPIQENRVLFFNYGHSTRLPHPTFVYTGLDPYYQDRSYFADLGNPDLDPEVDVAYELGLRTQFSSDDALNLAAFWRDKYDFISVENALVRDPTGREVTRAFRINGDFARVRGLEVSYLKRIGTWFQGQASVSYSRATGLSSTNNDALTQFLANGDIDNTFETPLAWDRPLDVKGSVLLTGNENTGLFSIPGTKRLRVYVTSTYRSGQRYTPVEFKGRQVNPFTGENDWRPVYETVSDPARRYSELGAPWWWFDLTVQKTAVWAGTRLAFTVEVTNLFNQLNAVIVNPVTGDAYPDIDPSAIDMTTLRDQSKYDVPDGVRDMRYDDPNSSGLPPLNPARFLPQRHVMIGVSVQF